MTSPETTAWELIERAASGEPQARQQFAERYLHTVREWMSARWRNVDHHRNLDDAVQEVFVECLKQRGALEHADRESSRGFRPYLQGVMRNVALRHERRGARQRRRVAQVQPDLDSLPSGQTSHSLIMDREAVLALVRAARERMAERAARLGGSAVRRVELLQLRFEDGLPLRAIALRWQADAAVVHHMFAKARREFWRMLKEVVAAQFPGTSTEVAARCDALIQILR